MVRFSIVLYIFNSMLFSKIYIPLWLDFQSGFVPKWLGDKLDLHSTMVRFSIDSASKKDIVDARFTFHYGQIFNEIRESLNYASDAIYIPLWLDFQFNWVFPVKISGNDLHSTMVRFSMTTIAKRQTKNNFIYIPLWLDFQ